MNLSRRLLLLASITCLTGAVVLALVWAASAPVVTAEAAAGGLPEVKEVAQRIERLRAAEFRRLPRVREVSREDQERDAKRLVAEARSEQSRSQKRRDLADQEVYRLLGMLEPGQDLVAAASSSLGTTTLGHYRFGRPVVNVVTDAARRDPVGGEITLAHELNHALDDQRFDLEKLMCRCRGDEEVSAMTALVEGIATTVEAEYQQRYLRGRQPTGALDPAAAKAAEKLPPLLTASQAFVYQEGASFVRALRQTKDWKLVELALKRHPPTTSEHILHPDKYLRFERPRKVELRAQETLGAGWTRARQGQLGEFGTRELVNYDEWVDQVPAAAAGWGGDRYELWTQGSFPAKACASPCVKRNALVVGWRWDSARDAREFTALLRETIELGLAADVAGRNTWTARRGAIALRSDARATTLAFAPTRGLARRLAETGPA